jgi:hypothetical protein
MHSKRAFAFACACACARGCRRVAGERRAGLCVLRVGDDAPDRRVGQPPCRQRLQGVHRSVAALCLASLRDSTPLLVARPLMCGLCYPFLRSVFSDEEQFDAVAADADGERNRDVPGGRAHARVPADADQLAGRDRLRVLGCRARGRALSAGCDPRRANATDLGTYVPRTSVLREDVRNGNAVCLENAAAPHCHPTPNDRPVDRLPRDVYVDFIVGSFGVVFALFPAVGPLPRRC